MIKKLKILAFIVLVMLQASVAFGECQSNQYVTVVDNTLLINGKVTQIKAVSYSISYPGAKNTAEVPLSIVDKDFKDIKAAGFNAVRSYEPWSPELIDLLEANGLYLIEGVIHIDDSTNFDSEDELQEVIDRAVSVVKNHRCRKPILFWSLWNDAPFNWGLSGGNVVSRFGEATVSSFLKKLYKAVKSVDGQHPITASNVANAKHFEIGMDVVDVIGINAYLGVYDWVTQSYSNQLGEELVLRLKGLSTKYRKPIWISEVGSASVSSTNDQGDVIPQQIRLLYNSGFIGYSIFQWHDDWSKVGGLNEPPSHIEARWGLRDAYRKPKAGYDRIVKAVREPQNFTSISNEHKFEQFAATEAPLEELKDATALDSISYLDSNALRQAYSEKSMGYSHAFFSLSKTTSGFKQAFKMRFVPEDFGSWLLTSRKVSVPLDISSYTTIAVRVGVIGNPTNVSIFIKMQDGRVYRSNPLPLSIPKTTTYLLPISSLFIDWLSSGERILSSSSILQPSGKIDRLGFRVNNVANYEVIGVETQINIEGVMLLK